MTKDDPKKAEECDKIFDLIEKGKIDCVTSGLVLAELVWTGMRFYNFSKYEISETLEGLFKLKYLKIVDDIDFLLAVDIFKENSIKFVDAAIAANSLVRKNKTIVVSYDRDFDKIKVKRIEPKDLLQI